LNVHSIANDCGIDNKTATSWLGVLESSFIVYFLKSYYNNYNKQITKSPKLYFYDTGLLCHLLHISHANELQNNMHKGAVFENFIITERVKQTENFGLARQLFFWRDKTGNEVDLITDNHKSISIAEIRAAETINPSFWKTLLYFEKLHGSELNKTVYYGGNESQIRSRNLNITGWSHKEG
jgi:predicted AAA+ superfamily ATPase